MNFSDMNIHSFNGKTVQFGADFANQLGIINGVNGQADFKFA